MNNNPATPLGLRKLKAEMALKGLSLTDVSLATRIPYLTISRIINGRLNKPEALKAITTAVAAAPIPMEAAAAIA